MQKRSSRLVNIRIFLDRWNLRNSIFKGVQVTEWVEGAIYVVKYLCSYILQLLINFDLYVNEKKNLLLYLLIWSVCKCKKKIPTYYFVDIFSHLIFFLHQMEYKLLY